MKLCAACSQALPKEKFSKKQWQLKQRRRCKECILDNRELQLETPDDAPPPPPPPCAGGEEDSEWTDEDLFKEPSEREECPICLVPLPLSNEAIQYQSCCGKMICAGCIHAGAVDSRRLCPFCRTPEVSSAGEFMKRLKKRAEADDADAIYQLGGHYDSGGLDGLQQDSKKAVGLWLRAGNLGCAAAYHNLAVAYDNGRGVERDMKKAKYYYELAAMGGNLSSRYNLGVVERDAGNMNRAVKHWMIAARAGHDNSLQAIRVGFMHGIATKDDFEKALRAHKEVKDEIKSEQREAANAFYSQN